MVIHPYAKTWYAFVKEQTHLARLKSIVCVGRFTFFLFQPYRVFVIITLQFAYRNMFSRFFTFNHYNWRSNQPWHIDRMFSQTVCQNYAVHSGNFSSQWTRVFNSRWHCNFTKICSTTGNIVTSQRSILHPDHVDQLLLKSGCLSIITLSELNRKISKK